MLVGPKHFGSSTVPALLFRCFVAVSGRCFERKNDARSETWQGMVGKFPNRSGIRRVSGHGRTHLYGALDGLAANPLHLQQKSAPEVEKAALDETRQPVFSLLIQVEQASLFEAWKQHCAGAGACRRAPQFARSRAANPALAKALQKAVKCRQRT
jgi:hypothetical protein